MRDFTLRTYHSLLSALKDKGYQFQPFRDFIKSPASRSIILRHDVDARKMNSLILAKLEKEMGISGTYYFRIVPESYDESVIREIAGMGHEVGYHYEEVSTTALRLYGVKALGRRISADEIIIAKTAINSFKENLEKLRKIVPVETICMHGSPLSRWDNRLLWKYYDYRDFGIVGEPYLDIDFDEVLYLTDTGRRWDGGAVAIRDKAQSSGLRAQSKKLQKDEGETRSVATQFHKAEGGDKERSDAVPQSGRETKNGTIQFSMAEGDQFTQGKQRSKEQKHHATCNLHPAPFCNFHSTFDIITATRENNLPDKIMLTVHPQRWDDHLLPWLKELLWQNIKNSGKLILNSARNKNG